MVWRKRGPSRDYRRLANFEFTGEVVGRQWSVVTRVLFDASKAFIDHINLDLQQIIARL